MKLTAAAESFALAKAFTISRGSRTSAEVVRVQIEADGITGQGECVPYARYGESIESVLEAIHATAVTDRAALQSALPAGAARNAIDCALWDLEAKQAGRRVWEIAGLPAPLPVVTAYTLSLDAPEAMKAAAAEHASRPLLKTKLGSAGDLERIEAVRAGAPDARIIVDANEGWSAQDYRDLAPALQRLGVELVEQPMAVGADAPLGEVERSLPVCADESCHDRSGLAELKGRYDLVNIKLDKTGGLTEALALKAAAKAAGFGIMVGCMVGTSLAMAPAMLIAQGAAIVDLDGPLLLAEDRPSGLLFEGSTIHPPTAELWG